MTLRRVLFSRLLHPGFLFCNRRRCVRIVKTQSAEDDGSGSVLKYMTKPKSDSYAADWPLWHADLLTVQPSRLDSLAYQRAGRSLGFQSVIIKTECASGTAREERRRLFVPYSPPLFDSLSLSLFVSSSLRPFDSLTLSLFVP